MKRQRRDWGVSSARGQQSWHALREQTHKTPGVKSLTVKRRQIFLYLKGALLGIVGIVIIGSGALWVGSQLQEDRSKGALADSKPLASIRYKTNGVLSQARLGSMISVSTGTRLIDVDIHAIKRDLESIGQVKQATVERDLPDTLRIQLQEHKPILRMVIENAAGEKKLRMVSRTGEVFEALDQPPDFVRTLPYLGPFQHNDGSYFPLGDMEQVANLLNTCEVNYPNEFQKWNVVLLTRYRGQPGLPGEVIEVRTKEGDSVERLIFSASFDFEKQLDRLRYIREVSSAMGDPLVRADFSMNNKAVVEFKSGRNKLL